MSVQRSESVASLTQFSDEEEEEAGGKGKRRFKNQKEWSRTKKKDAKVKDNIETSTCCTKKKPVESVVPARQQKLDFVCRCKCSEKFSEAEKKSLFKQYNDLSSWSEQTVHLKRFMRPRKIARERLNDPQNRVRNREKSFDYFFEIVREDRRVEKKICQIAFLAILGITRSRLRWKPQDRRDEDGDRRGKNQNRPNAIPVDATAKVREFIKGIPARESHYSRNSQNRRKYLDSWMTVADMHREFFSKYPEFAGKDGQEDVIKYSKFHHIFVSEFNIGFGYPRSDLCDTCEKLHAKIQEATTEKDQKKKDELQMKKEFHLRRAQSFFTRMQEKQLEIKGDPSQAAICFDFEKNLPLPVTGAGPEYYMRQLWLHNFCVHNIGNDDSHMFMYSEHYAGKGPNEVISLLNWYFTNGLSPTVKVLQIFADNCGAQNKNRFIFAFFQSLVEEGRFESICVAYPLPGHSFMPCDRDFGLIEKKRRRMDRVKCPSEWVKLVKSARPSRPFRVVYVEHHLTDDLKDDGTDVVRVYDYKKTFENIIAPNIPSISKFRGVVFQHSSTPKGRETSMGDCHIEFNVLKKPRRGAKPVSLATALKSLALAFNSFVPIKSAKFKDVVALLDCIALPETVTFYKSLKSDDAADDEDEDSVDEEF